MKTKCATRNRTEETARFPKSKLFRDKQRRELLFSCSKSCGKKWKKVDESCRNGTKVGISAQIGRALQDNKLPQIALGVVVLGKRNCEKRRFWTLTHASPPKR
jgi:hypothetical protein